MRDDYAGSAACTPCHADVAASFAASPMHGMTRALPGAHVEAPWDRTFAFKGDSARLETRGAERFMHVDSKRIGKRTFHVTRVIGGHHREDFAGREVGPGGREDPDADELVLPVSWLVARKTFRYKGYSVMVHERPALGAGPVWNRTCVFCHNTVPYLATLYDALAGSRVPSYQGEVVDPLLSPDRRATYAVTDEGALVDALAAETRFLGWTPRAGGARDALVETARATRANLRPRHLVEIGIGCEACHNGARAHAERPASVRPTLVPRGRGFAISLPERERGKRAADVNRVCARCHQVLFSGYPSTWEGGRRASDPGGSNINSGEARDFLLGGCSGEMSCTACHDPHAKDATLRVRSAPPSGTNATCTRCHAAYATPDALAAHSHHRPDGAAGACVECHMPRKNLDLEGTLGRYHRIGTPTDARRVTLDRPVECALCHADRSVDALVTTMERWWQKRYDRSALVSLYGSLDANVMLATAERGKPHEQAVAYRTLGERARRDAVPVLARGMNHPYPLVRAYARDALERVLGAPSPVDLDGDPDAIARDTEAWIRSSTPAGSSP